MVIVTLLPNYAFADKNIDIDIVESSAEVNFVEFESFSEFVEDYALVSGKTIAEAESELMSKGITSRSSIQYGYFTKRLTVYPTSSFQSPSVYYPTIKFYCTYVNDPVYSILSIISPGLNRYDGSIVKQFLGQIDCHLDDYRTIEYQIDGQFYNSGSTSEFGASSNGIYFSVTSPTGLYSDIEQYGRIILS